MTFEIGSPKAVTLGQQYYNVREKPTQYNVPLHLSSCQATKEFKTNYSAVLHKIKQVAIIYDNNAIELYNNRSLSQQ